MNEKEAKKTARDALRSGRLNGTWTRDELTAVLNEIMEFFSWKDKKKRVYIILWLVLIASVIALVISAVDSLKLFLFLASLAGIAGSVVILVLSIKKSLRLFVNSYENFTLFSKPFLEMLGEDIREGSSLEVDLALNDVANLKYKKETSEVYTKGKYFDCRDHFSEMPFIIVKAALHDGNRLTLSVMDYCKRTVMTKKSPKGRTKIVNRYRLDTRTSIRLRVNPGNFRCKKISAGGKEDKGDTVTLQEVKDMSVLTLVSDERVEGKDLKDVGHTDPMPLYQKMARIYSHLEQV